MALRVDYVLRETGSNLRRNISLTLASMLTVAVSLSLVGAALLIRQGVDNATIRWRGGIEFIVFLNPEITPDQTAEIERDLTDNPDVDEARFVSQQEAYEEFKILFRNQPDMVEAITPDVLPASFRIVPRPKDPAVIEAMGQQYSRKVGVREVVFGRETVESVLRVTDFLRIGILIVAVASLVAAGLLILNTIRMAMFARRREIEVMKLVGATNWFIRVPFMLEGLVQGLIGAITAIAAVTVLNNVFEQRLVGDGNQSSIPLLENFSVSNAEVTSTAILILVIGVLVGTIGSGIAVTRYLDV